MQHHFIQNKSAIGTRAAHEPENCLFLPISIPLKFYFISFSHNVKYGRDNVVAWPGMGCQWNWVRQIVQDWLECKWIMTQSLLQRQPKSFSRQEMWYSSVAKLVTWFQSNRACFSLTQGQSDTNKEQLEVAALMFFI